jgi:KUP system potassium uptake protein
VILVALFLIQQGGTAVIGRFFGPVMVVWFSVLALLGGAKILSEPSVLRAVNTVHAARFFTENGHTGFLALGAVFLVVTGGEALYADMGHFGRQPIKLAWFTLVLPALLLNYFGQGALLIADHEAVESPFFNLAPSWSLYPLVALATAATIIASQALISGVFSLTLQAIQLGYAPRHRVKYTSATAMGQIYIPAINWALMAACIALVIGFGSSADLAAAYGVAVTSTMLITTALFYVVLRERFGWPLARAAALCGVFLAIDAAFLGANVFKIPAGGWFPLLVAGAMFSLMTTWRTGRRLVAERSRRNDVPLRELVTGIGRSPELARRVPGTAVYLFSTPGLAPPALVSNLRHNDALHDRVIILSVATATEPRVLPARRATVEEIGHGVHQVVLHYGFMEEPDVPEGLCEGAARDLAIDLARVTYFLGAEVLRVTEREGMAMWREHLFAAVSRNAAPAAVYFKLPLPQTISLGTAIEL